MPRSSRSWWRAVPSFSTVPPNKLNCQGGRRCSGEPGFQAQQGLQVQHAVQAEEEGVGTAVKSTAAAP